MEKKARLSCEIRTIQVKMVLAEKFHLRDNDHI